MNGYGKQGYRFYVIYFLRFLLLYSSFFKIILTIGIAKLMFEECRGDKFEYIKRVKALA